MIEAVKRILKNLWSPLVLRFYRHQDFALAVVTFDEELHVEEEL